MSGRKKNKKEEEEEEEGIRRNRMFVKGKIGEGKETAI